MSIGPPASEQDEPVELPTVVAEVARRWGLDATGWSVVVGGATTTVRLPAADAALHVSRPEVGRARVTALQTARAALAERDIPVVALLPSREGRTWEEVEGRVVEVEHWTGHDGRMNTWTRLRAGTALLARVHDAWSDVDLGTDGETCTWANWISPTETVARCERAARRLSRVGLEALAADVVRLAELTAGVPALPDQVVHGDFWDDNVYVCGEQLVAVTDFDFLGRRPRIDDLALLLYFADEQPYFDGSGPRDADTRLSELAPLGHAYADGLASPLSADEQKALPSALARQPLWTFGVQLIEHPDDDHVGREAVATAPAVARALEVMADADRWADQLTGEVRGRRSSTSSAGSSGSGPTSAKPSRS